MDKRDNNDRVLMTFTDFAEHMNVNRSWIYQAKREGRLSLSLVKCPQTGHLMIDRDVGVYELTMARRKPDGDDWGGQTEAERELLHNIAGPEDLKNPAELLERTGLEDVSELPTVADSNRRLEYYKAMEYRVKLLERMGRLLNREIAGDILSHIFTGLRNRMMALPSSMALELSGIDDPRLVQERLEDVIREILTEASRVFSGDSLAREVADVETRNN